MTQGADHHVSAAVAVEIRIQPFPTAASGELTQGIISGAISTRN